MSDPKRLLDALPEDGDLGKLLAAGKSDLPNSEQLGSLATKVAILGSAGGTGAIGSGSAGVGATASKLGLAAKFGSAVILAGIVTVTAIVARPSRAPSSEMLRAPASNVAMPEQPAPPTVVSEPAATAPSASTSAAPAARTTAAPTTEGPEVEVNLLERAQDALRSRPADALAIANEHARRFPRGMLVQEREVIGIEALVKLGRVDEATARATRFKSRFPESSHTRRVNALVDD